MSFVFQGIYLAGSFFEHFYSFCLTFGIGSAMRAMRISSGKWGRGDIYVSFMTLILGGKVFEDF